MSDPSFREERIVERPVEREVVVERPARTRVVTETRTGGYGYGSNPVALIAAAVVAIFIIYLVAVYLL